MSWLYEGWSEFSLSREQREKLDKVTQHFQKQLEDTMWLDRKEKELLG